MKKAILFTLITALFFFFGSSANADLSETWNINNTYPAQIIGQGVCTANCPDGEGIDYYEDEINLPNYIISALIMQRPDGTFSGSGTNYVDGTAVSASIAGSVIANSVNFTCIRNLETRSKIIKITESYSGTKSGQTVTGSFSGDEYEVHKLDSCSPPGMSCPCEDHATASFSGSFRVDILGGAATKPDPAKDANQGEPKDPQASAGDPINSVTGNMYVIASDLSIPGKGPGFDFTRTYNSQEERTGVLGYGWTHSYNLRLTQDPDTLQVKIKDQQDKGYLFNFNSGNNSYLSQRGEHSVLTKTSTNYIWTKKDGLQYLFDLQGKLTQLKDRWGNAINLTYNAQDQLTKITDASGRQVNLAYDAQGRITRLAAPLNRNFDYRYDSSGNLASVTDPAGNITSYSYDSQHNLTRKIDANAKAIDFTYDAGGRCTSSSGENNLGRTTLAFDPQDSKTAITDSKGNVTTNYYNQDSLIIKVTDPQGNNTLSTWDNNLNLINRTDPFGRTTNMAYDALGNLIQVTDPAGNITKFTYEPNFSLLQTATDAQGNVTTYTYDVKGNLTKVTDAAANNTFYSYNASGQATGTQNALGKMTYFTYDTQGNLAQTKDALGYITTFTYDALGNLLSSKDPRGNITQFSYNNLSRLTQTAYADNSIVTYAYDALGNRTAVADALGQTTYYTYDQAGELKSTTDALGQSVWYDHDSEGNLTCVTDQNNNKTTYAYDSLNRLIKQTDARGNITQYSYDKAGNRVSMTDAKGQTTYYIYDNLNRLIAQGLTPQGSDPSSEVSYTYDSLGRRLTMADSQGTTTYTYDKLGRLTKVDGPGTKDTFFYTYDALGNRLTMLDPDAKATKYAYDALNRVSTITDPQDKITTYAYDPAGNQASVTYPNGTKAAYSYDNLNRLTKLTNAKGTTKLSEFSYTYDRAGRKLKVALLDASAVTYTYDNIGQLIKEKGLSPQGGATYTTTYTYDPAGNRLTQKGLAEHTYTYNSLNQLASEEIRSISSTKEITVTGTASDPSGIKSVTVNGSAATITGNNFSAKATLNLGANTITVIAADNAGNTTTKAVNVTYQPDVTTSSMAYSYDANGNLIQKGQTPAGSDPVVYTYDSFNRLISVAGASSATYAYNGDGKRISKTLSSTTTQYLYDDDEVALEKTGSTTTNYTHGARVDEIISDSRGNYYHYDGLGSVAGLTNSSGAQLNSYAYEGFGNLTKQTGTTTNPWLFTGRQYDAESGLYYYRNRYYDPKIGRFITQDPAGMVDGPNLYAYVNNNPVNFVDPWGLCKKEKRGSSICPRYGNWGGLDWSGGREIRKGEIGPINVPAQDSMDALFKKHDISSYEANKQGNKKKRYQADVELYGDLIILPDDPGKWGMPASDPERARRYREDAEWWFGDVVGARKDII